MTALQVLDRFSNRLSSHLIYSVPNINTNEVFTWINEAIERMVSQKYNGTLNDSTVEEKQRTIDDLRVLYVPNEPLVLTPQGTDKVLAALPDDYFHLLEVSGVGSYGNCLNRNISFSFVQYDDMQDALADPFLQPKDASVIYNYAGNNLLIFKSPSLTIQSVNLTYLRAPRRLHINGDYGIDFISTSEFSKDFMREAIEQAVMLWLAANPEQYEKSKDQYTITE